MKRVGEGFVVSIDYKISTLNRVSKAFYGEVYNEEFAIISYISVVRMLRILWQTLAAAICPSQAGVKRHLPQIGRVHRKTDGRAEYWMRQHRGVREGAFRLFEVVFRLFRPYNGRVALFRAF